MEASLIVFDIYCNYLFY